MEDKASYQVAVRSITRRQGVSDAGVLFVLRGDYDAANTVRRLNATWYRMPLRQEKIARVSN